jgi:hypothetical protein
MLNVLRYRTETAAEEGFGLVGVLIAIIVLVVAGSTGAYVYHRDHEKKAVIAGSTSNKSPRQATAKTTTGSQSSTTTQGSYLTIKEWGVHLTLDSTMASMYYYISPNLPDVAYFSLKTISDIAPNCAADKGGLGAIARLTEAEQKAATANPSALNQPATIHIGNYWYSVVHAQGACMDNAQQASVNQVLPSYNQGEILKTLNTLAAD